MLSRSTAFALQRHLAAAGINWASTASRPSSLAEASIPKNGESAAERAIDLVAIFAHLTKEERRKLPPDPGPGGFSRSVVRLTLRWRKTDSNLYGTFPVKWFFGL